MLAYRWSHSMGTNLWPLGSEELRIFRLNLKKMWDTELGYIWKTSVLIASVVFFALPSRWESWQYPLRTTFLLLVIWQGTWWLGEGGLRWMAEKQPCRESDGHKGDCKWRDLGPVVCVIKRKDWSASSKLPEGFVPLPTCLFPRKLPNPTVVLGTTSQFSLLSAFCFPANNQWHFELNVFLKGALIPP